MNEKYIKEKRFKTFEHNGEIDLLRYEFELYNGDIVETTTQYNEIIQIMTDEEIRELLSTVNYQRLDDYINSLTEEQLNELNERVE